MRATPLLITSLCLGLAACGEIGASYAEWYDPQTAKSSGPIDVTVIGSGTGSAESTVAAAVTDALRAKGIQAGDMTAVGIADSHLRLTLVYGSVAKALAAEGDGDNNASVCKLVNGAAGASMPRGGAVGSGSTPVLAVLCSQNAFLSLAYGDFDNSKGSDAMVAQTHASSLIDQVFPAMNWEAYDNANRG